METAKWQVEILHRTSRIVSSGLSIDDMLAEIIAITVEVTSCEACLVYLPDHETGDVVLRASQLPHDSEIGNVRLSMGEGIAGWVAKHKTVVALSRNAWADSRFKNFSTMVEDTYEALLSVPLVRGGEVIGVFNVHHREEHVHTPEEISLLSFLGEQMGGVIAYSELAQHNTRLKKEAMLVRQQLEERKLVERAKGILQQRFGMTEQDSYQSLREESRKQRKSIRDIAEAVLMVENIATRRLVSGRESGGEIE
ncbi:MAG TPA: GAF domain-containing protein [Candidatus Saccharimonadales bacterium]|nr:GAF domain-containing protein [Candidatus Saccharimonadales bacterium]